MKQSQKWMSYLAVLSVLAVLEVFTADPKWEIFLGFLPFLAFARVKADERYKANMNKAARNGFIASILGIIGLVFMISGGVSIEKLVIAVQVCMWIMMIVFAASFTLYDRKGIS